MQVTKLDGSTAKKQEHIDETNRTKKSHSPFLFFTTCPGLSYSQLGTEPIEHQKSTRNTIRHDAHEHTTTHPQHSRSGRRTKRRLDTRTEELHHHARSTRSLPLAYDDALVPAPAPAPPVAPPPPAPASCARLWMACPACCVLCPAAAAASAILRLACST